MLIVPYLGVSKSSNILEAKAGKRHHKSLSSAQSSRIENSMMSGMKASKRRILRRAQQASKKMKNYSLKTHSSPKKAPLRHLEGLKDPSDVGYLPKSRVPKTSQSVRSGKTPSEKTKYKFQSELVQLELLLQEQEKSSSEITFSEYLKMLQSFKLISEDELNKEEENLVTKTWHQISFYSNGNIVTSGDNLRILITGLLGVHKNFLYRKPRNLSMSYQAKAGSKSRKIFEQDLDDNTDPKCFRFKSRAQLKQLQQEFLTSNKFEL